MKSLLSLLLAFSLAGAMAAAQTGQTDQSTPPQASQSQPDQGQSVGDKTKDAARQVGTTSKKVGNKLLGRVDINNDSKDHLMQLEGINGKIADRIIANRPYKSKNELVSRKVMSQTAYKRVSGKLIAHAPKTEESTTSATK